MGVAAKGKGRKRTTVTKKAGARPKVASLPPDAAKAGGDAVAAAEPPRPIAVAPASYGLRISSWNVNGLRSVLRSGELLNFVSATKPHILCLTETKISRAQTEEFADTLPGYTAFWNCGDEGNGGGGGVKKGYSGTATFVHHSLQDCVKPVPWSGSGDAEDPPPRAPAAAGAAGAAGRPDDPAGPSAGAGADPNAADCEGRVQIFAVNPPGGPEVADTPAGSPAAAGNAAGGPAEAGTAAAGFASGGFAGLASGGFAGPPPFYLVNTYVVNAGRGLPRLEYKIRTWSPALYAKLAALRRRRPVVWCGDLNVAHEEIDVWSSKGNARTAGHTPEERQSFGEFLSPDWADVFREKHPESVQFTYWSGMRPGNRRDNKGWRLDYFIVARTLLPFAKDVETHDQQMGSDHCPVTLVLCPLDDATTQAE